MYDVICSPRDTQCTACTGICPEWNKEKSLWAEEVRDDTYGTGFELSPQ